MQHRLCFIIYVRLFWNALMCTWPSTALSANWEDPALREATIIVYITYDNLLTNEIPWLFVD